LKKKVNQILKDFEKKLKRFFEFLKQIESLFGLEGKKWVLCDEKGLELKKVEVVSGCTTFLVLPQTAEPSTVIPTVIQNGPAVR
jgi:hypothetical protein